jgi:hypothetical protein
VACWDRLRLVLVTPCSIALRSRSDRLAWSRDGDTAVCCACQGEVRRRRNTLFDSPRRASDKPGAASTPANLAKESTPAAAAAWAARSDRQAAPLGIPRVIVAYRRFWTPPEFPYFMDLRRLPSKRSTHLKKEQTR